MADLALFYRGTCPYCLKVKRFMDAAGIDVPIVDVTADPAAYPELIEKGGKRQVPCLRIDGEYLYESDDIIDWMRANLA